MDFTYLNIEIIFEIFKTIQNTMTIFPPNKIFEVIHSYNLLGKIWNVVFWLAS